jgi:hypothetical protein
VKKIKKSKNMTKFLLDVALLIGFLFLMSFKVGDGEQALLWHEVVGYAGFLAVLMHLWLNRRWIAALPKMVKKTLPKQRKNIILAGLLAGNSLLISVTGVLISHSLSVSAWLGLSADTVQAATILHSMSAKLFMPIIVLHIAFHWKWIVGVICRLFNKADRQQEQAVPVTVSTRDR